MKFSLTINIKAPREKVVDIFLDPEKQQFFQDGFISKTLTYGTPNQIGAQSLIVYKTLELKETVLINRLPEEFKALYKHKSTTNTMHINFSIIDNYTTSYTSQIHYTKFNGFIIKLLAKCFPFIFKKQVEKWMNQFKIYVEKN